MSKRCRWSRPSVGISRRHWLPWVAGIASAGLLALTFWVLPRWAPGASDIAVSRGGAAVSTESAMIISEDEQQQQALFNERYGEFSRALDELESQAAGVWGGESFGAAKSMGSWLSRLPRRAMCRWHSIDLAWRCSA